MKQGSFIKMALATAIALSLASGAAVARDTAPKEKKEALYPNATRTEPKLDLKSEKDQKAINDGLDAANNGEKDKAMQLLQPLADGSGTSSKYAQALALQGIANMKYNDGDVKGAITTLKQALDIGVMPNDSAAISRPAPTVCSSSTWPSSCRGPRRRCPACSCPPWWTRAWCGRRRLIRLGSSTFARPMKISAISLSETSTGSVAGAGGQSRMETARRMLQLARFFFQTDPAQLADQLDQVAPSQGGGRGKIPA